MTVEFNEIQLDVLVKILQSSLYSTTQLDKLRTINQILDILDAKTMCVGWLSDNLQNKRSMDFDKQRF